MTIDILIQEIERGSFPQEHEHFGGANLILTDNPEHPHNAHDVVVLTKHAGALSWLVFQLKHIYSDKIDYMNKFVFYPTIGELMIESMNANDDLFETMLYVVRKIDEHWGR